MRRIPWNEKCDKKGKKGERKSSHEYVKLEEKRDVRRIRGKEKVAVKMGDDKKEISERMRRKNEKVDVTMEMRDVRRMRLE